MESPFFRGWILAAAGVAGLVLLAGMGTKAQEETIAPDRGSLASVGRLTYVRNETSDIETAPFGHLLAQSQFGLASTLILGPGYTTEEARKWFEREANKGLPAAQVNLAIMYANGWGTDVNYGAALLWLHAAADQHFARAYYNLGILYLWGRGVRRDDAEALRWFKRGAELGDSDAETNLGYMFDEGLSVPKNASLAASWYRSAADGGNPLAENNLADLYLRGEGVPQDDRQAYRWFRRAAEHGHTGARIMLGYLYSQGRGTHRDPEVALAWVMAASLSGDQRGKELFDSLVAQLSSEQVAAARKQALAPEAKTERSLSSAAVLR